MVLRGHHFTVEKGRAMGSRVHGLVDFYWIFHLFSWKSSGQHTVLQRALSRERQIFSVMVRMETIP